MRYELADYEWIAIKPMVTLLHLGASEPKSPRTRCRELGGLADQSVDHLDHVAGDLGAVEDARFAEVDLGAGGGPSFSPSRSGIQLKMEILVVSGFRYTLISPKSSSDTVF